MEANEKKRPIVIETSLLHPDAALRLVAEGLPPFETENVPLEAALGRVLARDLFAGFDDPPFDKAAMDGFAFGETGPDGDSLWRVTASVAAGSETDVALGPGECARVMTGAPLPRGSKGVQRVEWTDSSGGSGFPGDTVKFLRREISSNVILGGSNRRKGDLLLSRRILRPQDLGILASAGLAEAPVVKRPLVGIVSTGNEIIPPGRPLGKAEIYDSNGVQLAAQTTAAGCVSVFRGTSRDDEAELRGVLEAALEESDVLLVSGAVSAGDHDHVPEVLASLGVKTVFHSLLLKPGKPLFYGRRGVKSVFGLPGNPVSAFVCFEILVRRHLAGRMGLAYEPLHAWVRLASDLSRRETDRLEFLPARIEYDAKDGPAARPVRFLGSSMLAAFAEADCLVRMEIGEEKIEAGRWVSARLVRT